MHNFTCPQQHHWQSAGATQLERCPVCGAAPARVVPVAASGIGRVEEQSFAAGNGPALPATVMHSSDQAGAKEDSRDRTLAPALPAGALAVGRTVNATYEILGELGRGGMGVVYKARQLRLNRMVALKMILAGSHAGVEQLARFRAEAETLAPLQHTNIVQVYEVGELDGHPYFSLEYVEGGSLAEKLGGMPQAARQTAALLEQLARAMHFAHLRGIVHRDLKPANILLAAANVPAAVGPGGKDRSATNAVLVAEPAPLTAFTPKITDFGLAKNLESDSGHTRTGAILGTPSYISPEQASGRKEIGPATDVYALGAILYEMLTGRPPFRGESSMDTMLQVMTEEPVPPRRLQPKVPIDLETICLKALHKEPKKRYPSAEALADDLRRFQNGEPIQARPIGVVGRTIKWAKRRPALAALAFLGFGAFFTILLVSLYYNAELAKASRLDRSRLQDISAEKTKADQERQIAEDERQKAEEARAVAQERLEHSRRSLYAFQLIQAASLAAREPNLALELLQDRDRCPNSLQDFTWQYLRKLTDRERPPLSGGKQPIAAVALAPDGKTLATVGTDETVTLWDPAGKQPSRTLKTHHGDRIVSLAFAPDSQTLATASFDKTIKLHNIASGAEMATLEGHTAGVRGVAFSADGKHCASVGSDRLVILWDVVSAKPRATLRGHTGPALCLAFAPDGQTLATGGADRTVRLWDVPGEKGLGVLSGHTDAVLAVAFAPDGRLLASGSADRTARLWQPAERKPLETLRGHLDAVQAVAFAPDGKLLASGSTDKTVRLWQPVTGEERTTFKGHLKGVTALAYSRDGKTLYSGSADQTVKRWDARLSEPAQWRVDLGVEPGKTPVMAWAADGKTLATVSQADRLVRLADLVGQASRPVLSNFSIKFDGLALSPDGQRLAGATDDENLRLYELAKGQPLALVKAPGGRVACLAFSPDSKLLVSAGADGTVRFWEPAAKELKAAGTLPPAQGAVRSLTFSPNGKLLATSDEQSVKLWDVAGRKLVADLGPPSVRARWLAFSPDGKTLAVAGVLGAAYLWDVEKKQERVALKGHTAAVRSLAFSPDGKTLATGHADWDVVLWDAQTGQERATLAGHTDAVDGVSFPDAHTLLSLSADGVVRRWQAQ